MSDNRIALADDRVPVCPFCGSTRHDSERLHDGNVMQETDLVDAMMNVWLNTGEREFPADLIGPPSFPRDYSDDAQRLFRAKMAAALGTATRNMPYLAALRADPDAGGAVASLDERLKAAGMYTVPEMMGATPMTRWRVQCGMVGDLKFFGEWLDRRTAEFLRMKAAYDLGDKDDTDELYEWVFAHAGAFSEIRTQFKAATDALASQEGSEC